MKSFLGKFGNENINMPFGGALTVGIGSAIGGLAGLFGGGKQQKTQTSGTITNSGTQNQTGTFGTSGQQTGFSSPNLSPLQQALIQQFTGTASNLNRQAADLSGYKAQGLSDINDTSNAASQALRNNLATRGLSFSPTAANAETQQRIGLAGQQSQFLNSLPLLQRQLQQQSLQQLMNAFQVIPTGTTTGGTTSQSGTTNETGTSNSTQTQQGTNLVSGNQMGGLFSGLGGGLFSSLPFLFGNMGGSGNNNTGGVPGWDTGFG